MVQPEPALPLFHTPWWLDATGLPWQAAETRNGDGVTGYWPVTLEKKAGIAISRNPPLTPYLGPHVFYPRNLKEGKRDGFEHQTVAALLDQLPPAPVWAVGLEPGFKQVGLLAAAGFGLSVRQTFLLDLHDDETTLLLRFHEGSRRNLRQTAALLQIGEEPDLLPLLYRSLKATLERKGAPLPYGEGYMQRLFGAAHQRGQSTLWVARRNDRPEGLLWHAWDAERAYYLASSLVAGVTDKRVMTALIWQAIRHSKALGLQTFDFEGSMNPGIEAFFRNFGGRRELYLTLTREDSLLWRLYRTLRR